MQRALLIIGLLCGVALGGYAQSTGAGVNWGKNPCPGPGAEVCRIVEGQRAGGTESFVVFDKDGFGNVRLVIHKSELSQQRAQELIRKGRFHLDTPLLLPPFCLAALQLPGNRSLIAAGNYRITEEPTRIIVHLGRPERL